MKKMKRLIAVLLSGMMVMLMLTACFGGSGTVSIGKQFEEKYLDLVNSMRTAENGKLTNDSELYNRALRVLDKIDKNGKVSAEDAMRVSVEASLVGDKVIVTAIGIATEEEFDENNGLTEYTAKVLTPESLAKMLQEDCSEENVAMMNTITKIGIASVERGGKTYGAVAMQMTVEAE